MSESTFVDYYEVLESSPNAHPSTIEQLFAWQAQRFHPDVPESGDKQKFKKIAEAYRTLRTPAAREEFNSLYAREKNKTASPAEGSDAIEKDAADRHELLKLFYKKRRADFDQPGLAIGGLEHLVEYPLKVLEFHLWYCSKKNWLRREEGGQLAITVEGIDKISATVTLNELNASKLLLTA